MSDAIQHLFNRLTVLDGYPDALLGGIYANKPGYHNKRDNLPSSDESCQGPDNQTGPGNLAAGLDVTMHDPADMQRMTQRLIDLTFAGDARVQVLAYFLGTTDGQNVTGMDVRGRYWITSDDSHLWHEHLSIYRRYAGDHAAMDALADAILDTDHHPPEDDMTDEQWQFLQAMNLKLDAIQHHQIYTEHPMLDEIRSDTAGIERTVGLERDGAFIQPTAQRTVDMIADILESGPTRAD